jgi:hypothetical protein
MELVFFFGLLIIFPIFAAWFGVDSRDGFHR